MKPYIGGKENSTLFAYQHFNTTFIKWLKGNEFVKKSNLMNDFLQIFR